MIIESITGIKVKNKGVKKYFKYTLTFNSKLKINNQKNQIKLIIPHKAIAELLSIIQKKGPRTRKNKNPNKLIFKSDLLKFNKYIINNTQALKYSASQSLKPKNETTIPLMLG